MVGTDAYDHSRSIDDDERVSEAVLLAVSAVSGRPPLDLPPLQSSVDVDALNLSFASSSTVEAVRFTYVEHDVLVVPSRVYVRRPDRHDPG
jgi:hypothetical protein